jgi:protein SCO1/2
MLAAVAIAACGPGKLVGDPLPSPIAPNFTLADGPTGETVELSSLAGRVVLLTFFFTNCIDTCPLTAETIRAARDKLGDAAKDVVFVAVSVDPIGDTPAATRRFVEDHRLVGTLRYLVGSRADLARVWQQYGIVQVEGGQSVAHSDVLYLIDRHARARILLHANVTPDDLATDLRILTSER